jgi:hypothetical protein
VIFPCRPIIGFGRPDFTFEATEKYTFSVNFDFRFPELVSTVPGNALVFRAECSTCIFSSVLAILGISSLAKIGLAIVQTIAIDMVNKQVVGNLAYLTMHEYLALFSIFIPDTTGGIKISALLDSAPFVFRQAAVIVRIDDCVLALCQRDSAEGVPVANPPIQKHRQSQQP